MFAIEHIVRIEYGWICIGSGYIPKVIAVSLSGASIEADLLSKGGPFTDYLNALRSRPEDVKAAVTSPDVFGPSHTVYTHREGKILTKQAEQLGWPHCTHDGCIQYENKFSTSLETVAQWAKTDCQARIKWAKDKMIELETARLSTERELAEANASLNELTQAYPNTDETSHLSLLSSCVPK